MPTSQLIHIPINGNQLEGMLEIPDQGKGIVLFAHGSGSSRHSKRNNYVAEVIRAAGIGTLLFDLLTVEEDTVYETRFDIPLLTQRLIQATQWIQDCGDTRKLKIGYFGASTGAAAALDAAAEAPDAIHAVVSRGGRPDLAQSLPRVAAPTLLIVGGHDDVVIELNQSAYAALECKKELKIVPGATHLFEEPGTLEKVAQLATQWFQAYL